VLEKRGGNACARRYSEAAIINGQVAISPSWRNYRGKLPFSPAAIEVTSGAGFTSLSRGLADLLAAVETRHDRQPARLLASR
jgi:hypothetical protein